MQIRAYNNGLITGLRRPTEAPENPSKRPEFRDQDAKTLNFWAEIVQRFVKGKTNFDRDVRIFRVHGDKAKSSLCWTENENFK